MKKVEYHRLVLKLFSLSVVVAAAVGVLAEFGIKSKDDILTLMLLSFGATSALFAVGLPWLILPLRRIVWAILSAVAVGVVPTCLTSWWFGFDPLQPLAFGAVAAVQGLMLLVWTLPAGYYLTKQHD